MNVWIGLFGTLVLAYAASLAALFVARRTIDSRHRAGQAAVTARSLGRVSNLIFLLLWLTYVTVFAGLSLLKHESFNTGLDLAIFDQKVWGSLAGYPPKSTIVDSVQFLDNSFDPLLVSLVPFYVLLGDARTLLVVQTFALAAAAFPIYWYGKSQLGSLLALAVSVSFFLSPALQFVNLLNFHVIALSTPLLAFALYFLLRQRYLPFLICTGLAALVKEEVSLIVIGAGLYVLFVRRRRMLGLFLTTFGIVYLVAVLSFVLPAISGKPYFVGRTNFAALGTSLPEIVSTILTRPGAVWNILAAPHKAQFVLDLLVPLAVTPLAGIEVLLVALPVLAGLLLTNPNAAGIEGQYSASIIPSLYFATIVGLRRLALWRTGKSPLEIIGSGEMPARRIALSVMILVAAWVSHVSRAPGPFGGAFEPRTYVPNTHTAVGHEIARQVPPGAIVAAQEELVAHFSNRKYIYVFPSIPDYRQADYLAAERGRFFFDFHKGSWDDFMSTGYFEIVMEKDDFILARRKDPSERRDVRFGDRMTLIGFTLWPAGTWSGGTTQSPIITWRAEKPIPDSYRIALQVVDAQGHLWAQEDREPAGGFSPTTQWTVGKPIGDQYALKLPPTMPSGEYRLMVGVHQGDNYLSAYDQHGNPMGTEVVLATQNVEKNKASFTASQLQIEQPLFVDMQEMRFLGYVPPRRTVSPGEMLRLGLYWRARGKPAGDYVVAVQLRDSGGRVAAEQKDRPAGGAYPTTQWDAGEVLLDWHDWTLPRSVPAGEYSVFVVLSDAAHATILGETALTTLTIVQ